MYGGGVTDDLAYQLMTTSSRLVRFLRVLAGGAETSTTWRALAVLEDGGPMRVTAFAEADKLTQPSATALVRRLETDGLVTRTADPDDRRAVLVELTDTGRERLARHRADAARALGPILDALDPADRETLARAVPVIGGIADTGLHSTLKDHA